MLKLEQLLQNTFQEATNLPDLSQKVLEETGLFDIPVTAKIRASLVEEVSDHIRRYNCVLYSDGFSEAKIWGGALTVNF